MRPCACGGEMALDYFDPVKRPIEWFFRCGKCGDMTPPAATPEAAEAAADQQAVT